MFVSFDLNLKHISQVKKIRLLSRHTVTNLVVALQNKSVSEIFWLQFHSICPLKLLKEL